MVRAISRMVIGLLLVPTLGAWGEDKVPLPMRLATSEKESPPEGAGQIGITTELFEISLTKLEKETGIKLDFAPNEQLSADKLQEIVGALQRPSSGPSTDNQPSQPIDAEEFLETLRKHNLAKVVTAAGQTTASGPQNCLVVGGVESIAHRVGTLTRTKSRSRTSFYAIERDENWIALDLRVHFAVHQEAIASDASWQQAAPVKQQEWQVATELRADETTIWMGPQVEMTEALEQRTWYGRREVVERVNRVATFLIVTPELRKGPDVATQKGNSQTREGDRANLQGREQMPAAEALADGRKIGVTVEVLEVDLTRLPRLDERLDAKQIRQITGANMLEIASALGEHELPSADPAESFEWFSKQKLAKRLIGPVHIATKSGETTPYVEGGATKVPSRGEMVTVDFGTQVDLFAKETGAGRLTLVAVPQRTVMDTRGSIRIDGKDYPGFKRQTMKVVAELVPRETAYFWGPLEEQQFWTDTDSPEGPKAEWQDPTRREGVGILMSLTAELVDGLPR